MSPSQNLALKHFIDLEEIFSYNIGELEVFINHLRGRFFAIRDQNRLFEYKEDIDPKEIQPGMELLVFLSHSDDIYSTRSRSVEGGLFCVDKIVKDLLKDSYGSKFSIVFGTSSSEKTSKMILSQKKKRSVCIKEQILSICRVMCVLLMKLIPNAEKSDYSKTCHPFAKPKRYTSIDQFQNIPVEYLAKLSPKLTKLFWDSFTNPDQIDQPNQLHVLTPEGTFRFGKVISFPEDLVTLPNDFVFLQYIASFKSYALKLFHIDRIVLYQGDFYEPTSKTCLDDFNPPLTIAQAIDLLRTKEYSFLMFKGKDLGKLDISGALFWLEWKDDSLVPNRIGEANFEEVQDSFHFSYVFPSSVKTAKGFDLLL